MKVGNIVVWLKLFWFGHVICLISNIMKTIPFDIIMVNHEFQNDSIKLLYAHVATEKNY